MERDHLICYCFGFGEREIEEELRCTGRSTVADRIAAEIRAGRCDCGALNPSGRCCLGDVRGAVEQVRGRLVSTG